MVLCSMKENGMANKRVKKMSQFSSGLGSYPLAVKPGEFLENSIKMPPMTIGVDPHKSMKYQSIGNEFLGTDMNQAFIDNGFHPYDNKDLFKNNKDLFKDFDVNSIAKDYVPSANAQINTTSNESNSADLFSTDKSLGSLGIDSKKYTREDGVSNYGIFDSMKDLFGVTDGKQKPTYQGYLAENGGIYDASKGMLTQDQWGQDQYRQQYADNQSFNNYAGAGMGAIQTGLGVLSYFDNKAMNKKNMDLLDQQILNNQDIMATRKARASDISKYFG